MTGRSHNLAALALGALISLLGLSGPGCMLAGSTEAVLVLEDLAAGDGPSRLKDRTPAPTRTVVRYGPDGRTYEADLYRPSEPPWAAVVLVPGVAEQGRRDPRLVALARTLARVRFLVLVPDLPGLRQLAISTKNVADVRAALHQLRQAEGVRSSLPVGLGAFSYAAGPAILAARDATGERRPDFVVAVGGYYDLHRVLAYLTTGYFRAGGQWRRGDVNPKAKWYFVRSNLERVDAPRDRRLLGRIAARRLADPDATVDDLVARLGPEGRAIMALLTNQDPGAVPGLLAELPPDLRRALAELTLANKDLSALAARLILIHGPHDPLIPYTESVALARAAPNAHLFLVDGLAHVELRPRRLDRAGLARAIDAVLGQRRPTGDRSRKP